MLRSIIFSVLIMPFFSCAAEARQQSILSRCENQHAITYFQDWGANIVVASLIKKNNCYYSVVVNEHGFALATDENPKKIFDDLKAQYAQPGFAQEDLKNAAD